MLRIGSLFSGAGLCDLGFHKAGFEHQFFCEIDPFCQTILHRHWPGIPIYNDIKQLCNEELPEIDVLVGGFPCQDVSLGGKRKGLTLNTRSGLWYEYKKVIEKTKPKYVVIENVKGLLSKGMGEVLQDIQTLGYDAEWVTFAASAVGAPHRRERVFIVAYPHGYFAHNGLGLLSSCRRNIYENVQFRSSTHWAGIQVDWASKQTIRNSYRAPALCRVADGSTEGLDKPCRQKPSLAERTAYPIPNSVLIITKQQHAEWLPRLKALGNGITPQQAYVIANCIIEAEKKHTQV